MHRFPDAGQRAARDEETGKTYYIPADMTYPEWKKAFVGGGDKEGLTLATIGSIMKADFESSELLAKHYEKYREEFGDISQAEYLEQSNQLLNEPLWEDVEQIIRSDGSIAKYKFSTSEFIVVTKDGKIRTYFKPRDGITYWRYEHERNG